MASGKRIHLKESHLAYSDRIFTLPDTEGSADAGFLVGGYRPKAEITTSALASLKLPESGLQGFLQID